MSATPLEGRVAVVTGASSGIGRQTALALAESGAAVAAVSRRVSALETLADENNRIRPFPADVASREDVEQVFGEANAALGPVSILVAAAGVARFGDTLSMDPQVWEEAVAVNLSGLYYCNVLAIRQMLEAGQGDVVNVLSISAEMTLPGSAAYSATKAGALALTRSLQAEYRSRGIRFCSVIPGATDTPLWDAAGEGFDRSRMMGAGDVAEAIVWAIGRPRSASVDLLHILPPEGVL